MRGHGDRGAARRGAVVNLQKVAPLVQLLQVMLACAQARAHQVQLGRQAARAGGAAPPGAALWDLHGSSAPVSVECGREMSCACMRLPQHHACSKRVVGNLSGLQATMRFMAQSLHEKQAPNAPELDNAGSRQRGQLQAALVRACTDAVLAADVRSSVD